MSLIKSISGIRGTIGGIPGESLSPVDIVLFVSAYALWVKESAAKNKCSVVLGRDARTSGPVVEMLVASTLCSMGIDVINLGMASTPTVELAVTGLNADGGIILTASHNPSNWNALKLLNSKGEFISDEEGKKIIMNADLGIFNYVEHAELGKVVETEEYDSKHIDKVLSLGLVNKKAIADAGFTIAIDAVNSVGGIILPELLKRLGVKKIIELNCKPDGLFAHNPEPLPENLTDICRLVKESGADMGFVVDPDVDRLAIINEDGTFFGEEYTLVAVADYVLSKTPGNTASNLSSTRALKDITEKYGMSYFASAVGEVNVVEAMKKNNCVIGGEGNGGIIYPELHYGRDALVGIALFLSHLAEQRITVSQLRKTYPSYTIIKEKLNLLPGADLHQIFSVIKNSFSNSPVNESDGLKIDFEKGWVHLRKSNTEPIIRLYAEGPNESIAQSYSKKVREEIMKFFE
jgi:phosphomannomutase